jgi:hypothetical protein
MFSDVFYECRMCFLLDKELLVAQSNDIKHPFPGFLVIRCALKPVFHAIVQANSRQRPVIKTAVPEDSHGIGLPIVRVQ